MKKVLVVTIVVAALATLAWLIWFKPARPAEEETQAETEVAVHIGQITRTALRAYVTAYGVVEPEPPGERPAASAHVASPVPGVVAKVSCAEGQRIEKGEVMFQIDSRVADVAVEKARQTAQFAALNWERQKKLIQVDGTSQKALLEAEQAAVAARSELAAAQTQQALLRVEAPLSGTVTRVNVKPGEAVDLTILLAELVDLDRLVVSASVPSTELASLKPGLPAEVLVENAVSPINGTLAFVSPQVDVKTGAALVRVSLPPRTGLRPGQWTKIRIVSEERQDRLAVPVDSVVKDADGRNVVALAQNNKARQKPVKTGLRDGGLVEIEGDGLQAGMAVVTEGAYGLPKETKIRVLESGGAEKKPAEKSGPEK